MGPENGSDYSSSGIIDGGSDQAARRWTPICANESRRLYRRPCELPRCSSRLAAASERRPTRHAIAVPGGRAIDHPDVDFRGPIHFVTFAYVLRPLGRDAAPSNYCQLDDICADVQDLTSNLRVPKCPYDHCASDGYRHLRDNENPIHKSVFDFLRLPLPRIREICRHERGAFPGLARAPRRRSRPRSWSGGDGRDSDDDHSGENDFRQFSAS